jgi:hypothetical protein
MHYKFSKDLKCDGVGTRNTKKLRTEWDYIVHWPLPVLDPVNFHMLVKTKATAHNSARSTTCHKWGGGNRCGKLKIFDSKIFYDQINIYVCRLK